MSSPTRPPRFLEALGAVRDALAEIETPSMFIGGVAVIAHGVPRYTSDIDATIRGAGLDLAKFEVTLRAHEILPRIPDALAFARANQVLLVRHVPSSINVDLSLAWLSFEDEALASAQSADFAGVQIRLAAPADLVIYKLIAARPQDLADAEKLILLHRQVIDVRRVQDVVRGFAEALEDPERIATAARLLSLPVEPHPRRRPRRPKVR